MGESIAIRIPKSFVGAASAASFSELTPHLKKARG
jgi:hypothetical protein